MDLFHLKIFTFQLMHLSPKGEMLWKIPLQKRGPKRFFLFILFCPFFLRSFFFVFPFLFYSAFAASDNDQVLWCSIKTISKTEEDFRKPGAAATLPVSLRHQLWDTWPVPIYIYGHTHTGVRNCTKIHDEEQLSLSLTSWDKVWAWKKGRCFFYGRCSGHSRKPWNPSPPSCCLYPQFSESALTQPPKVETEHEKMSRDNS